METKKGTVKQYFSDLFYSLFDTNRLFKFSVYSWLTPLIIMIITFAIMLTPVFVGYASINNEVITANIPEIDDVIAETLKRNYSCSIKDKELNCDKQYDVFNSQQGLFTYKVYVNSNLSGLEFNVGTFNEEAANENYLIFFKESFSYRKVTRDPGTGKVVVYKNDSFYDMLDGVSFSEIYQTGMSLEGQAQDEYFQQEADNIILKGFKAYAGETIYLSIVSNVGTYLLFVLVVALLIKGNYLLKRKKGFSYSQSLKVVFVSSMQSVLAAIVLYLFGINFINALGLAITVRSLYIYIKYTGSKKNTAWIETLYKETQDERFNV